MKNTLALSLLLIASAAKGVAAEPDLCWENSLKPKGIPGTEITLARDGKALYTILIPTGPSTEQQKAADDLAQWLGCMTGARFTIEIEPDSGALESRFISIGETRLLAASGSKTGKAKLGDEGYAIDEAGGNLFLTGGATRGPINAVYALLEEDLGCRWYTRSCQKIPEMRTLEFRPVKRSYVPQLIIRDPFYWDAFDSSWSLKNRTNSPYATVPVQWGGNQSYAMFVHTLGELLPPDHYFKDHPDYFAMYHGKRDPHQVCYSNAEAVKTVADNVKRALGVCRGASIISVSQNDSWGSCDCPQCAAVAKAEGGNSGPLLNFVNAVADIVGKDYPNITISTLAYLDTSAPPKHIRPHKNVAIELCTDSHAWSEPFLTVEETQQFQSRMKEWAAIGANIDIWDYTVNFSHFPAPMPNWQVVADDIRFFVAHNAKGVMLQGAYLSPGGADEPMRCWVWAKQLWDPSLDTRSLMKDFVFGYYNESAVPIWDYQMLLWNVWEIERHGKLKSPAGGLRFGMDIYDESFIAKGKLCFQSAEKLAKSPETLRRVEEEELQILYADLCRQVQAGKVADRAAFQTELARFERIARREKMTRVQEVWTPDDLGDYIARMRKAAGE